MEKYQIKNNTLIKEQNLMKELHKKGIKRINKRALKSLIKNFEGEILKIIDIVVKELTVKGKKTLEEKDVKEIFEKLKEKEERWEI